MVSQHCLCSPSSMKRWLACPASVYLSTLVENKPTDASEEGTLAHSIAEAKVKDRFHMVHPSAPKALDAVMEKATDWYADLIQEIYQNCEAKQQNPQLLIETKVDLSLWIPQGFGTVDAAIITPETLHIIDFKYGLVPVDVRDNSQLRAYAAGLYQAVRHLIDPKFIELTIFQPRNFSGLKEQEYCATTATYSTEEVMQWMQSEVLPGALKALDPSSEAVVSLDGMHQCQYCPAKRKCQSRAYVYESLNFPEDPSQLSDDDLDFYASRLKGMTKWLDDLKEEVCEALQEGEKLPGFSLETKLCPPKIGDSQMLYRDLVQKGIDPMPLMRCKGISELPVFRTDEFKEKFCEITTARHYECPEHSTVILAPFTHQLLDYQTMAAMLWKHRDFKADKLDKAYKAEIASRMQNSDTWHGWHLRNENRLRLKKDVSADLLQELVSCGYPLPAIANFKTPKQIAKILDKNVFASVVEPMVVVPEKMQMVMQYA